MKDFIPSGEVIINKILQPYLGTFACKMPKYKMLLYNLIGNINPSAKHLKTYTVTDSNVFKAPHYKFKHLYQMRT